MLLFAIPISLLLVLVACGSSQVKREGANPPGKSATAVESQFPDDHNHRLRTDADIAKLAWVNKRCRMWTKDGELDIDQTCIIVRTVRGGLVVIPNTFNDEDFREVIDLSGSSSNDKWIARFYAIGGGEKSK